MTGEVMGPLEVRPGVAAVITDPAGRVLLHDRRVGDGWALPSGAVEPGESVLAALVREVREETGLTVVVERLVGIYSDPAYQIVAYPDGRRVHFITCLFACRVTSDVVRGSAEGRRWAWFAPDALPEPLLPYTRQWLADATRALPAPVVH